MMGFVRAAWARLIIYSINYPKRLALLAGAILPLGFAPFFYLPIYYLALAAFFALLWQTQNATPHRVATQALIGFWFGFGQFFTGLIWIGEAFLVEAELFLWALPFAIILLPMGLALFVAAAAALSGWLVARFALPKMAALISYMLALSVADWARAHLLTGFPWNQPEQAWSGFLPLAQNLALWGPHGTALLVMLSAALLAMGHRRTMVAAMLLPICLALGGAVKLYFHPPANKTTKQHLQIILVQPNINQREKWQPHLRQRHIDKILTLTASALAAAPHQAEAHKLIIWPETALPVLLDESPNFIDLLRAHSPQNRAKNGANLWLLTGAVRRQKTPDGSWDYYNSTQLWRIDKGDKGDKGGLVMVRDKHHLVPFGEYLPWQNWLEAIGLQQLTRLRGGYRAGAPQARIGDDGLPLIAPLICYEVIFPSLSAHNANAPRPDVLVNLTNDGWFGTYLGPYQHFAQARLRAIEQGVPLIRVANTGISALFDAQGRTHALLGLGRAGTRLVVLPPPVAATFYARFGDMIYGFMLVFLLGFTAYLRHFPKII